MSGQGGTTAGPQPLVAPGRGFEITGDPWLDGVIFARGARKNKHCVAVKLGEVPLAACALVEERALRAGFEADYKEHYNAMTRMSDLALSLVHEDSLFDALPRFRERVIPGDAPRAFLEGYFMVATQIVPRIDGWGNPVKDEGVAVVHPWRGDAGMDDVLAAIERLGVRDAAKDKKKLTVPPEGHEGVEVFDRLREWTFEEEEQMLAQNGGKGLLEQLTQQMFSQEDKSPGVPVVCSVIDRRAYLHPLIVESYRRSEPVNEGLGPVMLVDDRSDPTAREVFWDYLAFFSSNAKRTQEEIPLQRVVGVELMRRYDAIILRSWPYSREYRELRRLADVVLEGKASGYGEAVKDEDVERFFPQPRPRGALVRFFIEIVRPGWFESIKGGEVRLKPLEQIKGKAKGGFHEGLVQKRLSRLRVGQILDSLGTLAFSPQETPPGSELLRHCTSCDGRIVLFEGVCCRDCGTAICIDCTMEGAKPLCSIHRSPRKRGKVMIPKKSRHRATADSGGKAGCKDKATKMKEIKIMVTEDQYQGLHARKVVSGKTLTQMVGEALEAYLKTG